MCMILVLTVAPPPWSRQRVPEKVGGPGAHLTDRTFISHQLEPARCVASRLVTSNLLIYTNWSNRMAYGRFSPNSEITKRLVFFSKGDGLPLP